MTTNNVLQHLDRNLLTITINRPERKNALSQEINDGLVAAFDRVKKDPEVRAVLLRGAGGTFCVGGDVQRMAGVTEIPPFDQRLYNLRGRMEISRTIYECPRPVVAMIDGAAAGAGLSIAMACDFRVASDTAKITTAFAKVGLSGDYAGTYYMTKLLGSAKARELYMLSPILSGKEALAIGLVTRSVPAEDVEKTATEMAMSLAQGPSMTLGFIKKNISNAEAHTFSACFESESLLHTACGDTLDHKEATKAFVEKRKPNFVGR